MKKFSTVLCLLLTVMLADEAWAKRGSPKPVTPVVHGGVEYAALNNSGLAGKIEARDEKTGKKLFDIAIYTVAIDPNLEEDVQWVFITSLAVQGDTLLVTNERNEEYILDLKTKKVERVKKAGKG